MCAKYRKKLFPLHFKSNNLFLEWDEDFSDETDSGNKIKTYSRETTAQSLNESHQSVGESPVRLKRIGETKYATIKVAEIEIALRKDLWNPIRWRGISCTSRSWFCNITITIKLRFWRFFQKTGVSGKQEKKFQI
jgi:hypothetical protein